MEFVSRPRNRFQRLLDRVPVLGDVLRRPLGALGFLIVLVFLLMVILAPVIAPYSYEEQDIPSMLQGPSGKYLLGTDHVGRDLAGGAQYQHLLPHIHTKASKSKLSAVSFQQSAKGKALDLSHSGLSAEC